MLYMNKNCLKNIKTLYKKSGKCDDHQQFKHILGADMVSTPEVFINSSTIYPMKSTPVKKPNAQKSLCMFNKILEVKNKNAYGRVGAAKYKRMAIKFVNIPW